MSVVQYIILRSDIARQNLGICATQAAHASLAPITSQFQDPSKTLDTLLEPDSLQWACGRFTKIVLEATPDQLTTLMQKLKEDNVHYCAINESTLQGELTGIGLRPCEKNTVERYFRGRFLLGNAPFALVDGKQVELHDIGYSLFAVDDPTPDLRNRFTLTVPFALFKKNFGPHYDAYSSNAQKIGNGDPAIDALGKQPLDYIQKNDPAFNSFLIRTHTTELLCMLPRKTNEGAHYIITSIDGIFATPTTVSIYGGGITKI